jgi:predicted transcriptional regulator
VLAMSMHGRSQQEIADIFGVSQTLISAVLRGERGCKT